MNPHDAKSLKEVCALRRDNFSTSKYWILTDGFNVTITEQKNGREATQSITVPRSQFNVLVRWYMKEQTTAKKRS